METEMWQRINLFAAKQTEKMEKEKLQQEAHWREKENANEKDNEKDKKKILSDDVYTEEQDNDFWRWVEEHFAGTTKRRRR